MNPPVPQSYLEDASGYRGRADRLAVPANERELAEVLRAASASGTPVTAVGAGTGVTGGRCAQGGLVVSLERFRRLDVTEGMAVAGAGVTLQEVQAAARPGGQFYAPDPTEQSASVGGTLATNASGSRSFRYGATRKHVLGVRVALMSGEILFLRRGEPVPFAVPDLPMPLTTKHSAGYYLRAGMDYLDLFIGSEGTLGIVFEAELKLLPSPEHLLSGVVFFASDAPALDAVDAWCAIDGLRMLEYMDAGSLGLLRPRYPEIPPQARAALLVEQELREEDSPEVDLWLDRLDLATALGDASWFGMTQADRERFRRFRHALPEAVNDTVRRNGFLKLNTDYAVPIPRNREMLAIYRKRLDQVLPGRYVMFGHIGDAHVHVNILSRSEAEFECGKQLLLEFAEAAVELDGSVGAEHGLGKRKAHLLALQYGPEHLAAMRAVKRRLDPQWLLGQGTLFSVPD